MMNNYDDIINLNRPISKHSHQSIESRASQFAPFAALVGYDSAIKETPRNEDLIDSLDDKVWEIKREIERFEEIEDILSTAIRMLTGE